MNHRDGAHRRRPDRCAGSVITHCNAGALATGGLGTALGVIREAWRRGLVTRSGWMRPARGCRGRA
jgi:methylthioribose-1-phosphate isomerase